MSYERIEVRPIAGALGAEIAGVDLARPLDNSIAEEIARAFREHLVIFFRDQKLSPEQLMAFGRHFGALGRVDFVKSVLPDHPEVMVIIREESPAKPAINFGNAWHSDMSYAAEPPKATLLHAREVPDHGGDTMWTNMALAYETLSPGLKRLLDGLTAIHCAVRAYGPRGLVVGDEHTREMVIESAPEALAEREHAVVHTDPETGRKSLFVNPVYTTRFSGMTEAESAPLLKFLVQHAVRPEFTCRFRWRADSLALWDNRHTMHFAINDYLGRRRVMHRLTIAGAPPA